MKNVQPFACHLFALMDYGCIPLMFPIHPMLLPLVVKAAVQKLFLIFQRRPGNQADLLRTWGPQNGG